MTLKRRNEQENDSHQNNTHYNDTRNNAGSRGIEWTFLVFIIMLDVEMVTLFCRIAFF